MLDEEKYWDVKIRYERKESSINKRTAIKICLVCVSYLPLVLPSGVVPKGLYFQMDTEWRITLNSTSTLCRCIP